MAARIPLRPWLEHLRLHLGVLTEEVTPASVHQLRVALARLRVWVLLADDDALGAEIRWLRRAAATVRDLDVQLSQPAMPPSLAVELRKERATAAKALSRVMRGARAAALLSSLERVKPLTARRVVRKTGRLAQKALLRGDVLVAGDWEAMHAFRRAVRRVRFALEWSGADRPECFVDLQSRLGDLNDLQMAIERAKRAPATRPVLAYRRALREALVDAERRALTAWPLVRVALACMREDDASARTRSDRR
ncbi:MAG: CHAD domain-containing protein [Myxococcales bacterium]|nr:CHAD domain-containing protein [Myxococcales bacterium]